MHIFLERNGDRVLAEARASRERYRQNAPLGPLDGVPVTVKDEIDVEGYHTTVGTKFLKNLAKNDAVTVARSAQSRRPHFGQSEHVRDWHRYVRL